ncbi:MAG: hypothetical protein Q7R96_04070 [Nanoarchaeota archaeon]|nr:hypothetical protein [Nanoarchaeota archaeon]
MFEEKMPLRLEQMTAILEFLPEPTTIRIGIHGRFDISQFSTQLAETITDLNITSSHLTALVKNPTKEKLREIFCYQTEVTDRRPTQRHIDLKIAYWYMGANGTFVTDGRRLFAQYQGESAGLLPTAEPKYLRDMRQALPFLPYTIYVNQQMPRELTEA